MIDSGEVKNAAQIAHEHGVTRAAISQTLSLLRLAPEIIACIDSLDGTEGCLYLTERRLREIAILDDHDQQRARFRDLVGDTFGTKAPTARRVAPKAAASREGALVAQVGA